MKQVFISAMMVAVMATAVAAPTPVVHAQEAMTEEERISITEQLIALLQQIIAIIIGQSGEEDMMAETMMEDGTMTLTITTDLAELREGNYEGWLVVGEEKISTGLFTTGGEQTFAIDTPLESIDKVAISIEPENDADAAPSDSIILVGDVVDGSVTLAFPLDLSTVAGSAILATPTDGADNNETSGVWFLEVPGPVASLELPELPAGWVYEGWAVHDGMPLTTGRFTDGTAADDFDDYSGTVASGPALPGEDFIQNAPEGIEFPIDLADGSSKLVISIEPDIEGVDPTGPSPAQIKPLLVEVPAGQVDHQNMALEQHLESVPSGTATLQ